MELNKAFVIAIDFNKNTGDDNSFVRSRDRGTQSWVWGLSIIRTGSNAKLLVMGVPIEPSENQKPQTLENS